MGSFSDTLKGYLLFGSSQGCGEVSDSELRGLGFRV